MSKQQVEAFFNSIGRNDLRILEFPVSSATVELAAVAVGAPAAQIAKTLTLRLKDRSIIVVMSGTARLSNHKFKEYFGCKAKLLKPEEVLAATGHSIGGVCPFGLKTPLDVYLDNSLRAFDFVYPAAGEANNAVKIFVDEFDQLIDATWIDVSE